MIPGLPHRLGEMVPRTLQMDTALLPVNRPIYGDAFQFAHPSRKRRPNSSFLVFDGYILPVPRSQRLTLRKSNLSEKVSSPHAHVFGMEGPLDLVRGLAFPDELANPLGSTLAFCCRLPCPPSMKLGFLFVVVLMLDLLAGDSQILVDPFVA